jgi:uncharacterized protein YhdP
VFNAALLRARAEIADLRGHNALLRVDGEASGPTADFLRFVAESPVAAWIDHFTDGAEATGAGNLSLKLELPLGNPAGNRVAGEYTFSGNRVKLPGDIPAVNRLNGKLVFTERDLRPSQLTGDVLGGASPVRAAWISVSCASNFRSTRWPNGSLAPPTGNLPSARLAASPRGPSTRGCAARRSICRRR